MTYPTKPALSKSIAEHKSLWDGLVWLYLPGHNDDADIISGDVLARNQTTTIDTTTYQEGTAEIYNLAYRIGTATPLEGTTEHTLVHYFRHIGNTSTQDRGTFGTASSITWANVSQNIIRRGSGIFGFPPNSSRHMFRRNGSSVVAETTDATPLDTTQIWISGRRGSDGKVFVARNDNGQNWSADGLTGSLSNTEPVIIGSYLNHGTRRAPMAFFWGGIWDRELTTAEQSTLFSDPYAVFRVSEEPFLLRHNPRTNKVIPVLSSPTVTDIGANCVRPRVTKGY